MFLFSILRWIVPPNRRTRIISTIFRVLLISLFLGVQPAASQEGSDDNTWLISPTFPLATCGAYWGMYNSAGNQKFHNAIDYCGGSRGEPVVAVADGVVIYADWWQKDWQEQNLGHGWTLAVWHPQNKIYSYYTHLQEFKMSVGDQVKKGDIVGLEGDTGKADGTHVHFVMAIMEPQRMLTASNCPQPYCFPNPDDFLGKNIVAQDLGLTTISPTGEVFKPASDIPLYTIGRSCEADECDSEYILEEVLDPSYLSFVETAMNTDIPSADTSPSESKGFSATLQTKSDDEISILDKIDLKALLKGPSAIYSYILAVVFLACFLFSERFRRGTLILALIIIPLALFYFFWPL